MFTRFLTLFVFQTFLNKPFLRFTVTLGDATSIFYLSLQDFCFYQREGFFDRRIVRLMPYENTQ